METDPDDPPHAGKRALAGDISNGSSDLTTPYLGMIDYRGFQYRVVRTLSPNGWRWSVAREGGKEKAGFAKAREIAEAHARRYIDRLLKADRTSD